MTGGGGQVGQCTIYEVNYQRKKQSGQPRGGRAIHPPSSAGQGAGDRGQGAAGEQKLKTEAR